MNDNVVKQSLFSSKLKLYQMKSFTGGPRSLSCIVFTGNSTHEKSRKRKSNEFFQQEIATGLS